MLKFKVVNRFFVLASVFVIYLIYSGSMPLYVVLIVFGLWFAITAMGATNIRWDYFFPSLHKNEAAAENAIALTFDDGPSENTLDILRVLKRHNVKATFFCIGHKIDEHPEIFRKIVEDGHQVGNHSYSHSPVIGFFKTKNMIEEINTCNQAAKSHAGIDMKLFRPPGGVTNPKIGRALKHTDLQSVGWSVRSFDALFTSEDFIFKLATKTLKTGDVVLLHDTKTHTVALLERLLLFLEKRNFKLLTIGSLFKINVYR